MKEIYLTHGLYAIVDDDRYDFLCRFNWHAREIGNTVYAARTTRIYKSTKRTTEYMHHYVIGFPLYGYLTDHINHNGLDERYVNLRNITKRQNCCYRKGDGSSKYPGVSWYKRDRKWRVSIEIDGNSISLGNYESELMAFIAYRDKILEIGEVLLPEHEELYTIAMHKV